MFRCLWTNSLTWDEQLWRGTLGSDLLSVQGTGKCVISYRVYSVCFINASPSGLQQSLACWLWASYHLSKRQFLHLENDLTSQDGAWTWIPYCTEALGTVPGSTIKSSWTEGPWEMLNFFSTLTHASEDVECNTTLHIPHLWTTCESLIMNASDPGKFRDRRPNWWDAKFSRRSRNPCRWARGLQIETTLRMKRRWRVLWSVVS